MKLNILFLLIGLILTVISKVLQFIFHSKMGDIIVIPAAISFVLALLFSLNKFITLLQKESGSTEAIIIATLACVAVVLFQVGMMLLVGYQNKFGYGFIGLFVLLASIFMYRWGSL